MNIQIKGRILNENDKIVLIDKQNQQEDKGKDEDEKDQPNRKVQLDQELFAGPERSATIHGVPPFPHPLLRP